MPRHRTDRHLWKNSVTPARAVCRFSPHPDSLSQTVSQHRVSAAASMASPSISWQRRPDDSGDALCVPVVEWGAGLAAGVLLMW